MGLLDDAIREHLELKRRRGADPAEIERAEREALGPVRRRYEEPGGVVADSDSMVDDDALHDVDGEDWHAPLPDEPATGAPAPAGEYEELDAPEPPARWQEEDPFAAVDPATPASASPPEPSAHGLDAETSEYDVTADHDSEEDVLEETPEFLQDTPDHDRLWFEQRPPRDFDFDG
jgi:hypothetical protein